MGVLHVVHGIGRILLLCHLDVEVDRLVGRAGQHKVARCIHAHLIDEFLERNHLAGTLGHAHGLPITQQVHQLAQHNLKGSPVPPCFKHSFAALHVTVMVGTPNVDELTKTALYLVVMVGAVAHEIGHFAVFLDEHTVLIVAKISGTEPQRTVLFKKVSLFAKSILGALNSSPAVFALHVETALAEERVEVGTKAFQRGTNDFHHALIAILTEIRMALGCIGSKPRIPIGGNNLLGDIFHIAATIALFRHFNVNTQSLLIAHHDRIAKHIHLNAMVVHVEFFKYLKTCMAKHPRRGIAQGSPTTMTHMHGTCGVRRNVFQVDTGGIPGSNAAPVVFTLLAHRSYHALQSSVG